jgi:hypothetical protein
MLRKLAFVILALVAVSCLLVAGQNPKFTFATIQITGDPTPLVAAQVRCEGTKVTTTSLPCPPGTKHILGRDEQQLWFPYPSEEYPVPDVLNGEITFVINCNFNADYRGPCWGTFEWDVSGIGAWEGTWTAPVMDLMTYESEFSMVGHGVGGEIDGEQLKFDGGSAPGDYFITGTVRIK